MYPTAQELTLPIAEADIAIVNGSGSILRDVDVEGRHLRMITSSHDIGAIQIARSLDEVDAALSGLTVVLALVSLGGVGERRASASWWPAVPSGRSGG